MHISQMALRELRNTNEAVWANKTVCGKWDYQVKYMLRAGAVRGRTLQQILAVVDCPKCLELGQPKVGVA